MAMKYLCIYDLARAVVNASSFRGRSCSCNGQIQAGCGIGWWHEFSIELLCAGYTQHLAALCKKGWVHCIRIAAYFYRTSKAGLVLFYPLLWSLEITMI